MDAIFIEPAQDTPSVILNKATNTLLIADKSYPEDAITFFEPVLEWLKEYAKDPNTTTTFEFKMEYFNTASGNQVYKILLVLEGLAKTHKVIVNWNYKTDDDDMESSGQIFSNLVNLEFNIKEY